VTSLAELPVGRSGRIVEVEGSSETTCRMMEMGLTPGVEVRVLGTAPWGDPIEIEVRQYRLSLRKCEAALIKMEPS
jgi:ferrous iron transport protein A